MKIIIKKKKTKIYKINNENFIMALAKKIHSFFYV